MPEQEREQAELIRQLTENHSAQVKSLVADLKEERALDRSQNTKLADTLVEVMAESNRVIGRCISVLEKRSHEDVSSQQ